MKSVEDFEKMVKAALRDAGRYTAALDVQIYSLASALRSMELANHDIDELETTTIETDRTVIPHPAFRIRKEAEASVTSQMKSLGLTADQLQGQSDDDPLYQLTKAITGVKRKAKSIKPKEENKK